MSVDDDDTGPTGLELTTSYTWDLWGNLAT